MSDDDFMQESDEEQYDFEYELEDDEESINVDIENKYYNAKQLKLTDPEGAIQEFLAIAPLEPEKGEWGYKGLKQAIKLEFGLGRYDDALIHHGMLLADGCSFNSRGYAEKSVSNLLEFAAKRAGKNATALRAVDGLFTNTLRDFRDTGNERAWLRTNIRFVKLLLMRKEYHHAARRIRETHEACRLADGSDDPLMGTYSLETYALEIELLSVLHNSQQLKRLYHRTLAVRSAVPHPRIMAIIREFGGKMHMDEENWTAAQSDFFEAFRNFDEAGSTQKIDVLKYLLLATMLMGSSISPFESQETKPYRNDPRIAGMTELVDAYQRDDTMAYQLCLRRNPEIMANTFIAENINEVTRAIRCKGVLNFVRPFERVRLDRIGARFHLTEPEVLDTVAALVVDKRIHARIDQRTATLVIDTGGKPARDRRDAIANLVGCLKQHAKAVLDPPAEDPSADEKAAAEFVEPEDTGKKKEPRRRSGHARMQKASAKGNSAWVV